MSIKIGWPPATFAKPGSRDAAHIPVVVVTSTEDLMPGQDVRFVDETGCRVEAAGLADRHGIVDPFLEAKRLPAGMRLHVLVDPMFAPSITHYFDLEIAEEEESADEKRRLRREDEADDGRRGCNS